MTTGTVTYVGSSQQINTSRTAGPTVATPSPASGYDGIGDFLLFAAASGTTGNFTTVSAGMTAIHAGAEIPSNTFRNSYRLMTGSDAASYSATIGGGGTNPYSNMGWVGRWRGATGIRASSVVASSGTDTSTSPTPPALSGTQASDLVVNVYCAGTSVTGSLTATVTTLTNNGWTIRANLTMGNISDDRTVLVIAEKVGATDRRTITSSIASDWAVLSMSLIAAELPAQQPGAWLPLLAT